MSTYRNRPPLDPSTELRRYALIGELEDILKRRRLRLTRIDMFEDAAEGSVPKQQIEDQLPIFSGANTMLMMAEQVATYYPADSRTRVYRPRMDPWEKMALRRQVKRRSAH